MLGAAAVAIWALVSATVSGPPPAATAARAPWTPTAASTTGAAARQLPSERVAAISVDAPSAGLERSAVEAIVQVVGAPYSIDAIRDSLQNLLALPDIADAQVIRSDHPRGLHLTFVVSPQPRLRQVHLTGDVPVSKSQLRRSLSIAPGDPLTEERIWAEAERLQQALADRGYSLASVEPRVLIAGDPTLGTLALAVSPGTLTRLGDFQIQVQIQDDIRGEIQGETGGLDQGELRTTLGIDFRAGQPYRPDELDLGIERLQRFLIEKHYFFARVAVLEQAIDLQANIMDLVIGVEAGPVVDFEVTGLDQPEDELHEVLAVFEFGTVDDWALKDSRHALVRNLQQQGYWKPLVSYSRERDEQGRNVRVRLRVLRGRQSKLQKIEFVGGGSIPESVLRAAIRSRESGFLSSARFVSEWWSEDQRAIEALYRRNGYLEAQVVDSAVINDPELGGLLARVEIREGDRTVVANAKIGVESIWTTAGVDTERLIQELQLRPGEPFNPRWVRRDADRLRSLLANTGYRHASVTGVYELTEPGAVITYAVQPGERSRVGRVLVAGNSTTKADVIRRALTFVPGSPYSLADILESQSRLYRLGIFDRVDVRSVTPEHASSDPTLLVAVREAPRMFVGYGGGIDSEEGARARLSLGHDNLFGRDLQASVSTRLSLREQRVQGLLVEPYLFGHRLESTLSAYFESDVEQSFDVERLGVSFQILKRHTPTLTSNLRYTYRRVKTLNVDIDPALLKPEDRSTTVGALGYTFIRDTRPDPIDPREGMYHTADVEIATGALGSATNFARLFGRSFFYQELGGGVVLAIALRAGLELPFGNDDSVPLAERFFAGGSVTLRGFGLDEAGPLDVNGRAVGGEVLLIGNVELRVPLRDKIGGVLFADFGNVFSDLNGVTLGEIRETLGFGLRYHTPVGPARIDVGRLIDRRAGERSFRLFVSIGHTF